MSSSAHLGQMRVHVVAWMRCWSRPLSAASWLVRFGLTGSGGAVTLGGAAAHPLRIGAHRDPQGRSGGGRANVKTEMIVMSVLIVAKFQGDSAKFRQALLERADDFTKFSELSRSAGAIHHRFGVGEGFVIVVDEWETAEQFEAFLANPQLQALIAETGGSSGPPEVTVTEAVTSADQF
jgi:hypothetical protein